MQQNSSWEANGGTEIINKIIKSCRVQKSLSLVQLPSQINPFQTLTPIFFVIEFTITLPSRRKYLK
jgi:hypothetical protein